MCLASVKFDSLSRWNVNSRLTKRFGLLRIAAMNFDKAKTPLVIVQPRREEVGRLLVRDEQTMNVVRERIVQRDQSRLDRILLERVVVVVQVLDRRFVAVRSLEIDGEHTARLVLFRVLTRAEFHAVVLFAETLAH